jgi:hypothetical protein
MPRAWRPSQVGDSCRAAADAEFAVGVLKVLRNSPRADLQRTGDGGVGTAVSDQSEDLHLALGEIGMPAAVHDGERLPAVLASASSDQGCAQRGLEHAEQGAVLVGEVAASPVQRDADDPLAGAGHADRNLMFDGYAAEELGVKAEAVEPRLGEKVADLHRLPAAGGTVMVDQWVLMHKGREHWLGRWVEGSGGVVRVARLAARCSDLVVGQDIAADQRGQAREHDIGEAGRIVEFSEAVYQRNRPLQGFQRDIHGRTPQAAPPVRNMRIDASLISRFSQAAQR